MWRHASMVASLPSLRQEAPWNVFDLILVILAVYDLIVSLQYDDGHSANMNFMRSLRVVKVSRILRLVRVIRVFRDLRCMLFSIIWSFSSLFWCLVLIFFVILVFSLLIVQLVTEHIVEKDVDGLVKEDFLYYFGSVQVTMATLYQACTGGVDWRNPYELLEYTGEMGAVAFLFYVAFFEFAVFNVLTGVFVDHAMKVSAADRELALAEQKKKERTEAERLRDTCRIIDADGDGKISWVEFHDFLQFENGYRNMASLGLDIFDSKKFFKNLMVMTNQREIEITQFVSGCMRMKGAATGIDLHTLVADLSTFQRRQEQLQEMVASTLRDRSIRFRSNDRVGSIVATPVSQAGASDPTLFASQSNASLSERSNSQGLVVAIPSEGARGIDATPSKPLRAGGLRKSRSELSQISDGFLSLDSVLPRAQEDEAGSQRYKLQI
ncbi:cac [Symbiodinium microadriaticum]|nr:cac [Symbiodinium microadriaticum]